MKYETQTILDKQAAWQRSRTQRLWSQKLRDCVAMRHALVALKTSSPSSHKNDGNRD